MTRRRLGLRAGQLPCSTASSSTGPNHICSPWSPFSAVRLLASLMAVNDHLRGRELGARGAAFTQVDKRRPSLMEIQDAMNDISAYDRSLNGNHMPACALATRGGVCDCLPPISESASWGQSVGTDAWEPSDDAGKGVGSGLAA